MVLPHLLTSIIIESRAVANGHDEDNVGHDEDMLDGWNIAIFSPDAISYSYMSCGQSCNLYAVSVY